MIQTSDSMKSWLLNMDVNFTVRYYKCLMLKFCSKCYCPFCCSINNPEFLLPMETIEFVYHCLADLLQISVIINTIECMPVQSQSQWLTSFLHCSCSKISYWFSYKRGAGAVHPSPAPGRQEQNCCCSLHGCAADGQRWRPRTAGVYEADATPVARSGRQRAVLS